MAKQKRKKKIILLLVLIFALIVIILLLVIFGIKPKIGSVCTVNYDCRELNCSIYSKCAQGPDPSCTKYYPVCIEHKCKCVVGFKGDALSAACNASGGTMRGFGDGCADSCELARSNGNMACTDVLTTGCDCGPDKCWNGESCELN